MPIQTLRGSRIDLRRLRRSDAGSIQKYANDPAVARFLPLLPHPYGMNDAREWINLTHRTSRNNSAYHFGIENSESSEIIGMMSLRNINRTDLNAEVGYWVARKFWGRGIATEALRLILRFSFEQVGLHRVYAVVLEKNIGSVSILEKLGFTREGVWRKASRMGKRWHDVYAYGILKDEFNGR